jgi:hypothetical protein
LTVLEQIYRRVYWLPKDLFWKLRLLGIRELIWFGDRGIGDDLLCSAVLREMHKRGRTEVAMMTNWPALFENLPYPKLTVPFEFGAIHCIERAGIACRRPSYGEEISADPQRFRFCEGHILEAMCRSVGIEGPVDLYPTVLLTGEEKERQRRFGDHIVIQTSRSNPRFPIRNKEWMPESWGRLAPMIKRLGKVVQVGSSGDPDFPGAEDMRGRTSLRELAAILAQGRIFIGLEGFLMHLARAVGTPAVILYGGFISPAQSGYPENINLFTQLPCSPCGYPNYCEYERECMRKITPETVADAAVRLLEKTAA